MCGIAGIIDFRHKIIPEYQIHSMVEVIRHRGPDSEGFFFDENLAFGHARLAIIDLTEEGNQPMEYGDRYVIIHNGEIYNYIELREELSQLGYSFRSRTDTEVIPASFNEWVVDSFPKFNGMWAFALYDRIDRKIYFSRDRFGIKPFYYYFDGDVFIFASEIKAILKVIDRVKVNLKTLSYYLITRYEDHDDETFFEGIKKLPQSSYAILDLRSGKFEIHKYYSLKHNHSLEDADDRELVNKFLWLIQDSIRLRLRSDVKVGSCLSGGLDSSTVATFASRLYRTQTGGDKFSAITAVSEDPAVDESGYARLIVEKEDLNWILTKPMYSDFEKLIEEVVYTLEEPFGGMSIFMSYFVMKASRENSVTVLLDGQGGDETLLGYERYYIPYLKELPVFKKLREVPLVVSHSRLSLKDIVSYYGYFGNFEFRKKVMWRRSRFLKKEMFDYINWDELRYFSELSLKEVQIMEITKYQLPHLLKYEDRTSMRHSIETRLPYLDYRFVEFAVSLPEKLKINKGFTKYILRSAMDGIMPKEITWRTDKFGFEAPIGIWLKNHNEKIKREIGESAILTDIIHKNKIDFNKLSAQTVWQLYNITVWERVYNVQN